MMTLKRKTTKAWKLIDRLHNGPSKVLGLVSLFKKVPPSQTYLCCIAVAFDYTDQLNVVLRRLMKED